jgi:hypothetical protein
MKVNPDLWEPHVPKLLEIAGATKDATSDLVRLSSEPRNASVLASSGTSLLIIGALLGHTQPATTARYAHLLDDPLREATQRAGVILARKTKTRGQVVQKGRVMGDNDLAGNAWGVLLVGLEIARSAEDKRIGTRVALAAVVQYLRTSGVRAQLWGPLHDLWCALADADRGISNELVDRLAYRGGTQKGIKDTFAWTAAAAKVTLLIKAKIPAPAALKRVAKEQGLNSKKLREFRKNIQRGHASPRAQKYYGWLLEDLADPKGAEQREFHRALADTTETDIEALASILRDIAERERG